MKKFLIVIMLLTIVGCNEEQKTPIAFHVLDVSKHGDVIIDAGQNTIEPKMKFDIYGEEEMPVARIIITRVSATRSMGTIVNRYDGSKPEINKINPGMICKPTSGETLKAEKAIYKYQKKALKRQYKLAKLKSKSGVYDSIEKIAADTNDVHSIKAGFLGVGVEKK